jgi:transposase
MNKMKDFIVRSKKIFIGLEDSKRTWKLSCRSEKMEVHFVSMRADYEVLRNYLRKNYPECQIKIMYEAGFKGFGLHDKLVEDGYECVVTPPNKVTQEKDSRVKTDKVDCRRLAITLENGDYKSCHVPDQELLADRQISRHLVAIQKDITRTKNRIRKFLDFYWVGEGFPAGSWTKSDYNRLMELELEGPLGISLNVFKELLQHLEAIKKQLEQELKAMTKKERYAKLCKIYASAPGIGWFTAIRLVLEWGDDLSRFMDAKHFASYTGLTGSEFSTGDTTRRGHITRQGSRHVMGWLTECAWTAKSRDPVLLEKYMSIVNRDNKKEENKKKAIIAVARKLAVRLWRCAVNGEFYKIGLVETC